MVATIVEKSIYELHLTSWLFSTSLPLYSWIKTLLTIVFFQPSEGEKKILHGITIEKKQAYAISRIIPISRTLFKSFNSSFNSKFTSFQHVVLKVVPLIDTLEMLNFTVTRIKKIHYYVYYQSRRQYNLGYKDPL